MGESTLIVVLGGLLILAAVIGGGFEVKEVKIPKIGGGARTLAGFSGILLLALGVGMHKEDSNHTNNEKSVVTFLIVDSLGENQVSEQVRVLIDGKEVGILGINEHYPNCNITVSVPRPGQYSYVLEAKAVFRNLHGQLYEIVGVGQGNIFVSHGKKYELASTITGDTWLAHMQEVAQ
jgi:hypothetical protein